MNDCLVSQVNRANWIKIPKHDGVWFSITAGTAAFSPAKFLLNIFIISVPDALEFKAYYGVGTWGWKDVSSSHFTLDGKVTNTYFCVCWWERVWWWGPNVNFNACHLICSQNAAWKTPLISPFFWERPLSVVDSGASLTEEGWMNLQMKLFQRFSLVFFNFFFTAAWSNCKHTFNQRTYWAVTLKLS